MPPYQYGSNTKVFHMVPMVGVEENSFINCKPVGSQMQRVLIERGEVFIMRNDIPHGGVENFSQYDHYRLHTFVKVKDWNSLGWDTKYNVKKCDEDGIYSLFWDEEEYKFGYK